MCGIAGIVNLDKRPLEDTTLRRMVDLQRHRGPDGTGIYINKHYGLGHARLSIIDLSPEASQPMANEDRTIHLVHNGEIYNYIELKEELTRLGHRFKSASDTEVIVHAYEEWGEGCLNRFNGMWSFAILDTRKGRLFCSRDRFGVKPLYYHIDRDVFLFSSEIKALLAHPSVKRIPNDGAIFNYLYSGYGYMDTSDDTFFKDVKQLKPAHYITLSLENNQFSQNRYWDLDPAPRPGQGSEDEVCARFFELLQDSVRLRLRSDVPVGISLSGGLDSSSIACLASKMTGGRAIETFSSCYEDAEYDERKFIRPVLEKTNMEPNFIFTGPDTLFEDIEDILWHQDEPYSTLSIFPQWHIMKRAAERGVKVMLTGQGGDEVLAGYHKYYYYLFADLVCSLKFGTALKEMRIFDGLKGKGVGTIYNMARIIFSYAAPRLLKEMIGSFRAKRSAPYLDAGFAARNENRILTEKRFGGILNNDLYNALKISPLPSLLHIDDRSSMAHGVETRSPFLDYRLVEYLFSLGPEFKIRQGATKYILRRSLKGILPEEVRTRQDKMGYATPLEKWFRSVLKDEVRDILTSRQFGSRPYFNVRAVNGKLNAFIDGSDRGSYYTIWSWVNLELWMRKFIDAGNHIQP